MVGMESQVTIDAYFVFHILLFMLSLPLPGK